MPIGTLCLATLKIAPHNATQMTRVRVPRCDVNAF